MCLLKFLLLNIIKVFLNISECPLDLQIFAQMLPSDTANSPDQLIDFRLQSSTVCMEKSPRHGKTDKTQKIALKRKIHGKWDFGKTEFQK